MLSLANLQPAKGSTKKTKRVGRGNAGSGTYSGRGQKGQRARSGGRGGLKALGLKQIVRRIPKQRGFKSLYEKMAVINLSDLEQKFKTGDSVDPRKVIKAGLIKEARWGLKILGSGKISKALKVSAHAYSDSAKKAIEAAGGTAALLK